MDDNIYAAPAANLENENSNSLDNEFYVVSGKKFAALFFSTMGLYAVYWYYKNWSLYKGRHNADLWPVPRAFFSIFFIHSLFEKVHTKLVLSNVEVNWNYQSHATVLLLIQIFSNLLDRLAYKGIGSPITDIVSLLSLLPLGWQFYRVQVMINRSCQDAKGSRNAEFTTANYLWIAIGLFFWVTSIYFLIVDPAP